MFLSSHQQPNGRTFIIASSIVIILIAITIALFLRTYNSLLPVNKQPFPLQVDAVTDMVQGGDSAITLHQNDKKISFDFTLSQSYELPYANLNLMFGELNNDGVLVDLSMYSEAILRIRCTPRNELALMLHVYEDKITELHEINSYRKAFSFFTCDEIWQEIHIDLNRLITPEWWLQSKGLSLSNQQYSLAKVKGISITNTAQSPRNQKITVMIDALALKAGNTLWLGFTFGFLSLMAVGILIIHAMGTFKRNKTPTKQPSEHTASSSPSQQTQLGTARQQPIEIRSKRERESDTLLRYLASNYSDAEMSLEYCASATGINRTKINQILKENTGNTFSSHLNKLRLTEAARLLKDKHITVSEAAYAVGFSSISYFNRVFKKEYGSSPSIFRDKN
ncbi:HTH-type transcriptional regulator YesS [Thalassocella blandensis]|nr:HTH-type transcriptional regulator YesS [Thalassocella blandensis]